jgi:hypothetical protein
MGFFSDIVDGVGSVLDVFTGAEAGKDAAKAAGQAQDQARDQFDTVIDLTAPQRNIGRSALRELAGLYGLGPRAGIDRNDFIRNTPGYQFLIDESNRQIDNMSGALGLRESGANLRALQDRGAQLAAANYGNFENRLASLAGIGQTATGQAIGGTNAATNMLQGATIQQGMANASSSLANTNALQSLVNDVAGMWGFSGFSQPGGSPQNLIGGSGSGTTEGGGGGMLAMLGLGNF